MPWRDLYLRDSNGSVLITPRPGTDCESNVFEKAFNTEMDTEWQNWMTWDGDAELDLTMKDRRESALSNISSPDTWSTDPESAGRIAVSGAIPHEFEPTLEDAPWELDEEPAIKTQPLFGSSENTTMIHHEKHRGAPPLTLTKDEERKLQDIAMPSRPTIITKKISTISSPTPESSQSPSVSPTADSNTRKYRKRKASTDEEVPYALCQYRKRGHNAIEKRYRTNLNDKIICLRQGIPALCKDPSDPQSKDEEDSEDDMDSKTAQQKYGKAAVLTRALNYIRHLEDATQRLGSEADGLRLRVQAFEKLAMGGSLILSSGSLDMSSRPPLVKSETLESIQSDFQHIKPEARAVAVPAPKRKSSRQSRS